MLPTLAIIAGAVLLALAGASAVRWRFRTMAAHPRPIGEVRPPAKDSVLYRLARGCLPAQGTTTALVGLRDGDDALAARLDLITAAEVSLDVQYYIWLPDRVGICMLKALRAAAERGVRVRLLLDDLGSVGMVPALAGLARHPNVEVRLFNPFVLRRLRALNLLLDFGRLNRRMHNKSLTADGIATIVGGRNLGDAYFVGAQDRHFIDFDALALGPAATAVSADFARYWNNAAAIPAEHVSEHGPATPVEGLVRPEGSVVTEMLEGALRPVLAEVTLLADDPQKIDGRLRHRRHLAAQLSVLLAKPKTDALLVTAYLIPGRRGLRQLQALTQRGVRVRVLTNGHTSTDVFMVHCRYARYRHALLRAGIELYELKPGPRPVRRRRRRRLRVGASTDATSLHSKTFVMDDSQVFVGSFNLDQRSAFLNTEMGLLAVSSELAMRVREDIEAEMAAAWRVTPGPKGRLQWRAQGADGVEIVRSHDPGTTRRARIGAWLVGRLPIDWLL